MGQERKEKNKRAEKETRKTEIKRKRRRNKRTIESRRRTGGEQRGKHIKRRDKEAEDNEEQD